MREDVTKSGRDIDPALQKAVLAEVGQERFDLWFGEGVTLRLTDSSLCVAAENQFALDRLRLHFQEALRSAMVSLTGMASPIQFQLEDSLPPAPEEGKRDSADSTPAIRTGSEPRGSTARSDPSDDRAHPGPSGTRGNCFAQRRFQHLDSYRVGRGNRVAMTAAQMVAERPGNMSPLFLFGPSGTGKTHLLEGIWSASRRQARGPRVLYLSAEQFTTMFLEALQGKGLPSFRHKYRHLDVLLIDDVQFFIGKRATIVELQYTIDTMLRENRQLVLAADRSPAQLTRLGNELTARFSGGLVCGIEPADYETRLAILKQRSAEFGLAVDESVLEHIAEHIESDARRLKGALHRLQAGSRAFGRPITIDLARELLADLGDMGQSVVKLKDIDRAVCDVFGLELSSLRSSRKTRNISQPRALAMWLARKYTRAAYSEIGDYFGSRSHSTVISANRRVNDWIDHRQPINLAQGHCDVREAVRRVELQMRSG